MKTVTSRDGTRIAYDVAGEGPALILIGGALSYRGFDGAKALVERLAQQFTVINYDRRGRGDSGDTPPYAVEREVEDIEALIAAEGGEAFLYGISSGAVLALEAASRLPGKVRKVLMYEAPLIVDSSRPPVTAGYARRLATALSEGRRGDAVALFMTEAVGVPAEIVAQMRYGPSAEPSGNGDGVAPEWASSEKLAHTLLYDYAITAEVLTGGPSLPARWAMTAAPVLVVTGGESPPFFHTGARSLVQLLPHAEHRILEGQDHAVAPEAIAPVIAGFFAGEPARQGPAV